MAERRQVHRREPIEVELTTGDVLEAKPLPWLTRNDLGDCIIREHTDQINNQTRMFVLEVEQEGDMLKIPQIELALQQKIRDWKPILELAYPGIDLELVGKLEFDDCVELAVAALEVNHLEQLRTLVDPNFQSPPLIGGISSSEQEGTEAAQKTESSVDSSLPESTEPPSLTSPTEKSTPLSTN